MTPPSWHGQRRLSRRALLAALALPAAAADAPNAGAIPSILARDVRRGWGVCARPGQDAPIEAYAAMLGRLGTRDLRVAFCQYGQSAAARLRALGQALRARGCAEPTPRVTALVTAYMNDLGTTWPMQQRALLDFAPSGMLRAIEGPNEIDNYLAGDGSHGPDDTTRRDRATDVPGNYLDWCRALGRFRRENPILRGVTLVAPSLSVGPPANFRRLGDVSAYVDAGNLHFYAGGGRQPSYSLRFDPFVGTFAVMLHWARATQMPRGPVWLTECGGSTSGNYARDGVSQAKYLANQLFDYFAGGGQQMFVYQLLDGSGVPGDAEGNFGLFHHDATPKPAAALLAGLQDLLSIGHGYDDPGNAADHAAFPPAYNARALAVSGLDAPGAADPSCVVLAKSDGGTLVAVWNEPVIDDGHGHDVTPPGRVVGVDFGSVQRFVVHDLMAPDLQTGLRARRARPGRGRVAELVLRGYPMLIELLA